jgi:hypothetical protein
MDIPNTLTSLEPDELRKLLSISQKDKSSEAYRATHSILDHSDLVDLIAERADANPEFKAKLIAILEKDPLFIDNILQTTSEAAEMLLSGENLDRTARVVVRKINQNQGLKRSFRKIYYIAKAEERINFDEDFMSFKKDLEAVVSNSIVTDKLNNQLLASYLVFFFLIFASRLPIPHYNLVDVLFSTGLSTVGGSISALITMIILSNFTVNESKIKERVELVSDAIWQFLEKLDENVAKEHASPEVEDAHKPPVGLMDILEAEENQPRNVDDEGHISGAIES